MQRLGLIAGITILTAAVTAVVLARPERVPAGLAPPPRSAASSQRATPRFDNGEPAPESDPADEPQKGYSLTRQDLEGGLLKVRARALACRAEAPPPVVPVRIVISPSGQIAQVSLPQEVRGTRAGDCIAHAIRGASFPAWSAPAVPNVEWTYPLRFEDAAD